MSSPVSPDRETVMLVEQGWNRSVVCNAAGRDGVRALFYDDGTVRIEHKCKTLPAGTGPGYDDQRPVQIVCAPQLQLGNGHTIVQDDPLTVVASIACPDCGLHGHITDGRWVPC